MGTLFSKQLPYTSDPFKLLATECWLFAKCSFPTPSNYFGLLSIVWPLFGWDSGPLDEIYPFSLKNLWATFWHGIIFILQVIFIIGVPLSGFIGLPFPPLLCTPVWIACFAGFIILNQILCCLVLNGPPAREFYAAGPNGVYSEDFHDKAKRHVPRDPQHKGERWVFINGVAVGSGWLQSNLDRLAATFRRPILGIHNATYGIPFDVLECIIQRTFCYPTLDIRTQYARIAQILSDKSVTKLVLIAHSQGCIEAGMVLDWLYATMPTADIHKLEIYTFGNAANHWNCPMGLNGRPVVEHIEHYAHEWDWVSRFGILHFRPLALQAGKENPVNGAVAIGEKTKDGTSTAVVMNGTTTSHPKTATATTEQNHHPTSADRQSTAEFETRLANTSHRFAGRLFIRAAPGHQFNQHYLDNMFPMTRKSDGTLHEVVKQVVVADPSKTTATTENGGFMDLEIDEETLNSDNTVRPKQRIGGGKAGEVAKVVGVKGRKVEELSRLWKYRNGGVPIDKTEEDDEDGRMKDEIESPVQIGSNKGV